MPRKHTTYKKVNFDHAIPWFASDCEAYFIYLFNTFQIGNLAKMLSHRSLYKNVIVFIVVHEIQRHSMNS